MNLLLPIILGIALLTLLIIIVRILLEPKHATHMHNLYDQGKYKQAIRIARQMIIRNPHNPDAHYFLGLCYEAEQKPELALKELSTVNRLGQFDEHINITSFRKRIAGLYLQFNQIEEALKEYLLLVQADGTNVEYCYHIGTLFEKRNRFDKAIIYYKKAININPAHANSYARLGEITFKNKRFKEAHGYFEKALKFDPNNAYGNYYLGKILLSERNYIAALQAFGLSVLAPELKIESLIEKGNCHLKMGNYSQAEIEFSTAVKNSLASESLEILHARYSLAALFEEKRIFDKAIEQWEEIFKVNEGFSDVAQKLENFHGLRTDDTMKDFLTSREDKFIDLCKNVILSMNYGIDQMYTVVNGCQIISTEQATNRRKMHSKKY